jgi:Methylamine utilisation protein MauE
MLTSATAKAVIASILVPSGLAKLTNRRSFVEAVRGFDLLPKLAISPFAFALPLVEIVVGGALLIGAVFEWLGTEWSAAAAVCLFAMFGAAVSINLLRGRANVACGCFGGGGRKLTWALVGRSLLCLLISLLALPQMHRVPVDSGNITDRLNAALLGTALVAVVWLGEFLINGGIRLFQSPSS